MNVRELIQYLSTQDPEALVVEAVPTISDEFVELRPADGEEATQICGVKEGKHARYYKAGRGRIPCVVLTYDNAPR